MQELENLIKRSEAAIIIESATSSSASEAGDQEDEDSCSNGSIDTQDDLVSRVQMIQDLVPTLEYSLKHVQRCKRSSARKTTESFYSSSPAHFYISLVRDKFPLADDRLTMRCGEANWQRHINVRRRMDGLIESNPLEDSLVGSRFQPPTLFHDSGIGTTIAAQTSSPQSEASHRSFISSVADTAKGTARVPSTPPEVSLGKPFRCFICGQLQFRIKNRVAWK